MNTTVIDNYRKLKLSLFFLPIFLLLSIVLYLYSQDALSTKQYIEIQKDCFYFLNSKLSQFPNTECNLNQFGDSLVTLSLLAVFFISAPKIWEAFLTASLLSLVLSSSFKTIFAVPRPAAYLDKDSFVIIGNTLSGHNSLPSGHSITIFTMLTILMFAFAPTKRTYKILWFLLITIVGIILIFTRVSLGAHYPLDVIIGGIIGYICALVGIFVSLKYRIWTWIINKKYYPVFMLLFVGFGFSIIAKLTHENLVIFYVALACLVFSLYKITSVYVQK